MNLLSRDYRTLIKRLQDSYQEMVKSLGQSIINMYSMGACAALGINNQEALSEDLENDPFLNSALQDSYKFPINLLSRNCSSP